MSLFDILRERIAAFGPVTVAEYIELALTHPEFGYYTRRDPFGVDGDFITAPEISQVFGELVGIWCADSWQKLGGGKAALVELGPGRGTLMLDFLRATRHIPGFHDAIDVHMVETSPALRATQQELLANAHPRIYWHQAFEGVPEGRLLLVANEFFDALPVRQYVATREGWCERLVDMQDEQLVAVYGPTLEHTPVAFQAEDEQVVEVNPHGERIMEQVAGRIARHGGAALIIDYGFDVEDATGDTLQAMRRHDVHPVFEEPGTADITAYVNFHALRQVAAPHGVGVYGIVPQGLFLSRIGAYPRVQALMQHADAQQQEALRSGIERLLSPQHMGTLFKVMAVTSDKLDPAGF